MSFQIWVMPGKQLKRAKLWPLACLLGTPCTWFRRVCWYGSNNKAPDSSVGCVFGSDCRASSNPTLAKILISFKNVCLSSCSGMYRSCLTVALRVYLGRTWRLSALAKFPHHQTVGILDRSRIAWVWHKSPVLSCNADFHNSTFTPYN